MSSHIPHQTKNIFFLSKFFFTVGLTRVLIVAVFFHVYWCWYSQSFFLLSASRTYSLFSLVVILIVAFLFHFCSWFVFYFRFIIDFTREWLGASYILPCNFVNLFALAVDIILRFLIITKLINLSIIIHYLVFTVSSYNRSIMFFLSNFVYENIILWIHLLLVKNSKRKARKMYLSTRQGHIQTENLFLVNNFELVLALILRR